jgi:DNA-binding CsgD family transcriptional regulator
LSARAGNATCAPLSAVADRSYEFPRAELSPREMQIAQMFVDGIRPKDIAEKLGITQGGLGTFRRRILDKLDIGHQRQIAKALGLTPTTTAVAPAAQEGAS